MKDKEVIDILQAIGYTASKIQESDERSADFLIKAGETAMIGELKTKGDSPEFLDSEERALETGRVHMHFDSTARTNRMSGIVGDSIDQIKNMMTKYETEFGILICEMLEPYAKNKVQKLVNTLYGRKFAVPINTKEKIGKWCYYCTYSDFFRYRDVLNAAFIISGTRLKVCINSVALNYTKFIGSELLKPLGGKFNDPKREVDSGEAFEVTGDIDRASDSAIQEYFKNNFGFEAVALMDFPSITASTRVM
jgi:hypothetical protein